MNDLGHTGVLIVIGLIVAAIFGVLIAELRERRAKKRLAESGQPPADHVDTARNLSVGALFLGPMLYFLGMHVFGLGGLKVGQLIGIGMLVCAGVSVAILVRAPLGPEPGAAKPIIFLVAMLVALLGVVALVMGAGRMRIYQ